MKQASYFLLTLGCTEVQLAATPRDCDGDWGMVLGDSPDVKVDAEVAIYPNGDMALAGGFEGRIDLAGSSFERADGFHVFAARLSSCGQHIWSKVIDRPTTAGEGFWHVRPKIDAADNLVLATEFPGSTDFGGGRLSDHDYVGGLLKLDADGEVVWSHVLNEEGDLEVRDLDVGPDGSIALVGDFKFTVNLGGADLIAVGEHSGDETNGLVAVFGAQGQHLWSKSFPLDTLSGVHFDEAGNVVVVGDFREVQNPAPIDLGGGPLPAVGVKRWNVIVGKFAFDGSHLWSRRFGGAADILGGRIEVTAQGDILLLGAGIGTSFAEGVVVFGEHAISLVQGTYFARLDADGEPLGAMAMPFVDGKALTELPSGSVVLAGQVGPYSEADIGGVAVAYGGFVTEIDSSLSPRSIILSGPSRPFPW